MARPSKPVSVINMEKVAHRTKAELEQRKNAEKNLVSGAPFKERKEVRENEIAHKEFNRLRKLFKTIEKNDGLYEAIVNRYCLIQAECKNLEVTRDEFGVLIKQLREESKEIIKGLKGKEAATYSLEYAQALGKLSASMINCDKMVQAKRKMLLDIEKENIMTVASALRAIPKKPAEDEEDPMTVMLKARQRQQHV